LHFEEAALPVLGTNFRDECNTLNDFIFNAALQYPCFKAHISRLLGRGLELGYMSDQWVTGQTAWIKIQ